MNLDKMIDKATKELYGEVNRRVARKFLMELSTEDMCWVLQEVVGNRNKAEQDKLAVALRNTLLEFTHKGGQAPSGIGQIKWS